MAHVCVCQFTFHGILLFYNWGQCKWLCGSGTVQGRSVRAVATTRREKKLCEHLQHVTYQVEPPYVAISGTVSS